MNNRTEIDKRIDILEDDIASINPTLLKLLLVHLKQRKKHKTSLTIVELC